MFVILSAIIGGITKEVYFLSSCLINLPKVLRERRYSDDGCYSWMKLVFFCGIGFSF